MGTCQACSFFLPADDAQGFCRRHPPQPILSADGSLFSQFPLLLNGGWCGEFKEKEFE